MGMSDIPVPSCEMGIFKGAGWSSALPATPPFLRAVTPLELPVPGAAGRTGLTELRGGRTELRAGAGQR